MRLSIDRLFGAFRSRAAYVEHVPRPNVGPALTCGSVRARQQVSASCRNENLSRAGKICNMEPTHEAKPLRILLIEDSRLLRERLEEQLTGIANVVVAGSADNESDAISALNGLQWDLALLDLQLKKGNGLGVLKAIGGRLRKARGLIAVFTNFPFPQFKERALALGADYFFDKAREFKRLFELIAELASSQRVAMAS